VNERLHALVDCDRTPRPAIFSAGIKAFERNHNQQQPGCKFRIRQEAVNYLLPHMHKRVLAMSASDFRSLISLTAKGSSKDKLFPESFSAATAALLSAMSTGCFIAALDDAGAAEVGAMLACVAWRGTHGERASDIVMLQFCSFELFCGCKMTVLCRRHHDIPGAPRGKVSSIASAASVRHASSVTCSHSPCCNP
jgi:hypothetical protein